MKNRASSSSVLALLVFGSAVLLGAKTISFPGKKSESKSPNGRFIVRNIDNTTSQPMHVLILIDSKSEKQTQIYEYGRHVDLLWSPVSDALVINDYEGSDFARAVLIELPSGRVKADLWKELKQFLASRHENTLLANGHIYLTVEKWIGNHELRCKLNGYGSANPEGVTLHYIYQVGIGFLGAESNEHGQAGPHLGHN